MSEKKDNLDIEKELENMKNVFAPINEQISPPYSVTPVVIEGKLDETKPHKTIFSTPLFRRSARGFFATAMALVVIAASVGTYMVTTNKPLTVKETSDKNVATVATVNDYSNVYGMLKKFKDKKQTGAQYEYSGGNSLAGAVRNDSFGAVIGSKSSEQATDTAATHGTTNTQVADVDEGDILKNDGKYLYFLSHLNSANYLKIIKADANGKMELVSSLKIEEGFYAQELYILDNQVILVGTKQEKITQPPVTDGNSTNSATSSASDSSVGSGEAVTGSSGSAVAPDAKIMAPAIDIAPGYYYGYGKSTTMAVVYDVSDKSKPTQVHSVSQDGYYISSRLVGSKLYLVTNYYVVGDLSKITEKNVDDYIPTTSTNDGKDIPIAATDIAVVSDSSNLNYAVVSGIELKDFSKKAVTQAVLGSGDTIFATAKNLYIACYRYKEVVAKDTQSYVSSASYTSVLRFTFKDNDITFSGSGDVSGNILNKYSMDETDGYFRIATTSRNYDGGFSISNNVYVLDKALKVVGKVEKIAPGETIQSVRFMGKMVYVVTFRQTDPLFAIDLSNPTSPKILGELKIPGFSAYLHPISEDFLLGVGIDGDNTGKTGGVKLSLFDVSDPKNPKEAFKYVLPGNQSYTAVANDPKAFMYDKENGILTLPVNLAEYDYKGYEYGIAYKMLSVLSLFKVDTSKGFTPLFNITNAIPVKNKINTFYSSQFASVLRGTYIGDAVFSVSENNIISANITAQKRIAVLTLTDAKEESIYGTSEALAGLKLIAPEPDILEIGKNMPVEKYAID